MNAAYSARPASHDNSYDDGLLAFMTVRPRLFRIAYRMLGSAAEADDVVQDVWLRWQTTDRRQVRNPAAFLVTATTRLGINVLQSARARKETRAEPWIPEPVDVSHHPGAAVERREALTVAVRLLSEALSPAERAAYVLREAFNYPYRTIASVLRIEEANARQLVTRARARLSSASRVQRRTADHHGLLDALVDAATTGNLATLEQLFTARGASGAAA
jgi:RNA polymerase sigma-70 factor (ECF subfamily)